MRKIFCDVCGVEIESTQRNLYVDEKYKKLTDICQIEDLCSWCATIGRNIDLRGALLSLWRDMASTEEGANENESLSSL